MAPENTSLAAVILAAGMGKRMGSPLAKVLHPLGGVPLVRHVVDLARQAGASPIVLVVGHQAEAVRAVFSSDETDLRFALQADQLGTGHAAGIGIGALDPGQGGDLILLCGDAPLIRPGTLDDLIRRHRSEKVAVTLLSAVLENPAGYGRILRDRGGDGGMVAVVEEKDASASEREIREINSGTYVFDLGFLRSAIPRLGRQNRQGEFYLTAAVAIAAGEGRRLLAVPAPVPEEALGVNTPGDLARAEAIWSARGPR
ncbi:MAG: NTP transferase domain-containing protein [bacterium]|nr:NTP transferase domain-containing protein [bacterium]